MGGVLVCECTCAQQCAREPLHMRLPSPRLLTLNAEGDSRNFSGRCDVLVSGRYHNHLDQIRVLLSCLPPCCVCSASGVVVIDSKAWHVMLLRWYARLRILYCACAKCRRSCAHMLMLA